MNFELTPEQRELKDSVVRFCRGNLWFEDMIRRDHEGVFNWEGWRRAAEFGFQGMPIPQEYGGQGFDILSTALAMEALGYGSNDAGLALAIGAHLVICSIPIWQYGSEAQKKRYLPDLTAGKKIGAYGLTEPEAGSDAFSLRTTATKHGDRWLLNGQKTFITNGQLANLICVVTKTDPAQGARGVSLMMVETEEVEGFRRGRNLDKIGMHAQDTSELFFDDVRVPTANLLGAEEGQGFFQLMQQLPQERLLIAVVAASTIDYALGLTIAYTKERKAFGKAIFDFQNSRFKLAEMATEARIARVFVDRCIELLVAGKLDAETAAMAKWWTTELQCKVADECLQLHGGYGYMMEYPIARVYLDGRVQKIYGGSNEIMKELIGRSL